MIDSHLKSSLEICSHDRLPKGGIKFLPNLRYLLDPRNPETYSREFIEEVARICDVYINCAFGCSHRVTKSVKMLPHLMRGSGKKVVGGVLLMEEIERLGEFGKRALQHPEKTAVIAGGAKISDKIEILKQFVESKIRLIFIGGRMVNAFLLARSLREKIDSLNIEDLPKKMWQSKNKEECQSLVDEVKFAQEVIEKAESRNRRVER